MSEQPTGSFGELLGAHPSFPVTLKLFPMTQHLTRESWLLAAIDLLRPVFAEKGYVVPVCQVSCGFTSSGVRSGHIGQCWSTKSSADALNHIFVSPILATAYEVLDTLVHELVHAVDNCEHKHGAEFKKIALKVGLTGPMRSAGAGPLLKPTLEALLMQLGPYPHGHIKVSRQKAARQSRPRAKCPTCGFQVPMFKKFLAYGPPICPKDKVVMVALGNWEEF